MQLTQATWFFSNHVKEEVKMSFVHSFRTHTQIWIPYAIYAITLWKLIYAFILHFSIMPPGKMLLDEKLSWITFLFQSTEMRVTINPLHISGLHNLLLNCHFNYSWIASLPPGKISQRFLIIHFIKYYYGHQKNIDTKKMNIKFKKYMKHTYLKTGKHLKIDLDIFLCRLHAQNL